MKEGRTVQPTFSRSFLKSCIREKDVSTPQSVLRPWETPAATTAPVVCREGEGEGGREEGGSEPMKGPASAKKMCRPPPERASSLRDTRRYHRTSFSAKEGGREGGRR